MTLSELGDRMSNHELNVVWPAYFRHKAREAQAAAEKQGGR